MRYAIVIERAASGGGFGAYAPDLPGVGVVGETREEVKQLMREAVELHLQGLREDGEPIPRPTAEIDYVDAAA
jgi:predicted RNase H-like HicB family nuclease